MAWASGRADSLGGPDRTANSRAVVGPIGSRAGPINAPRDEPAGTVIAVQFPPSHAPTAQSAARSFADPVREEWQPDGTWTGLFDLPADREDAFYDLVEDVAEGSARTKEIDSEADIGGHRMALYLF